MRALRRVGRQQEAAFDGQARQSLLERVVDPTSDQGFCTGCFRKCREFVLERKEFTIDAVTPGRPARALTAPRVPGSGVGDAWRARPSH